MIQPRHGHAGGRTQTAAEAAEIGGPPVSRAAPSASPVVRVRKRIVPPRHWGRRYRRPTRSFRICRGVKQLSLNGL